ncbi:MAG: zf-HC2 domain-containing protein [Chloroflexota bacterium]|nr:zf-HC2 domain-containing protein [Chloroflexota bacterium]
MTDTFEAQTAEHTEHSSTIEMSLVLDGLLDVEETARFHDHLARCESCRSRWTKWQSIDHILEVEPFVGPASGFMFRVDERIGREQQRRERLLGGLVLVGGTFSLWSLVLIGFLATTAIWLYVNSEARLQIVEYLAYSSQLVALAAGNLDRIQDALLALVPSSSVVAALLVAVALSVILWIRLVFFGERYNGYLLEGNGRD